MQFNPFILLIRFFKHLLNPFLGKRNRYNKRKYPILYIINFLLWLLLIPIKALEVFGLSVFLNFVFRLFTSTRRLSKYEQKEIKLVFGESIKLSRVRINDKSFWSRMIRKKGMGYVWLDTINFSRSIKCQSSLKDMAWLIHELVHIAQYNKLGIQYVFEALLAQAVGGYDYGGVPNLKSNNLIYFNLEQQGDIARDYYLALKRGESLKTYDRVIADLQKGRF